MTGRTVCPKKQIIFVSVTVFGKDRTNKRPGSCVYKIYGGGNLTITAVLFSHPEDNALVSLPNFNKVSTLNKLTDFGLSAGFHGLHDKVVSAGGNALFAQP